MSIIANFPTCYFPASHSGVYTQIFYGGFCAVPDDPVNAPGGASTNFHGRDMFEPWLRDLADQQNCVQAIIIVNDTGHVLKLKGTPHYDGGSLISQPVLPDAITINTIPAAYATDRATYLGMGRFVQDEGSIFYGSGIGMTLTASSGDFSQDIGIFVAGSVRGGYGLDVCANMAGVDAETRYNNGAASQNTRVGTRVEDRSGSLFVQAIILDRFSPSTKQFGDAAPLVFVHITG